MSKVTKIVKKQTTKAAAHRGVTWPSRGAAGRTLRTTTGKKSAAPAGRILSDQRSAKKDEEITATDLAQARRHQKGGAIRKETLATISNTSKTLHRALKRLADK